MITLQSVVAAAKGQISTDVGDEAVILNLQDGVYYGLNPLGVFVWKIIQEPHPVSTICDAILKEYDVEQDRCASDVIKLLTDLAAHQLVEIEDESAHAT